MVDIRSSTLTSSYSSGTLTINKPSGMVPGDFLVVFLVAQGIYYGNYYNGGSGAGAWTYTVGNPPPGALTPPLSSAMPPTGPTLTYYPHVPPVSRLSIGAGLMERFWSSTSGGTSGVYGNFWSNLGSLTAPPSSPSNDGVHAIWPFIDSQWGPDTTSGFDKFAPHKENVMFSLTTVARPVTGTEPASYSFTLNNPIDDEYDYRAFALCFEPNDWSGNFYDLDGTNSKSLLTNNNGYYAATGFRTFDQDEDLGWQARNVSTRSWNPGDVQSVYDGLDGYMGPKYLTPLEGYDLEHVADPSNPQTLLPPPGPMDLDTTDDLLLHILLYAGPTSYGDPADITIADLSVSPAVDPLPLVHREKWTKGSSTLMVDVRQTHVTPGHVDDGEGSGIVKLTARIFDPAGPIVAPFPGTITASPNTDTELGLGLAFTFRVRVPYAVEPLVAIPARLATIVG